MNFARLSELVAFSSVAGDVLDESEKTLSSSLNVLVLFGPLLFPEERSVSNPFNTLAPCWLLSFKYTVSMSNSCFSIPRSSSSSFSRRKMSPFTRSIRPEYPAFACWDAPSVPIAARAGIRGDGRGDAVDFTTHTVHTIDGHLSGISNVRISDDRNLAHARHNCRFSLERDRFTTIASFLPRRGVRIPFPIRGSSTPFFAWSDSPCVPDPWTAKRPRLLRWKTAKGPCGPCMVLWGATSRSRHVWMWHVRRCCLVGEPPHVHVRRCKHTARKRTVQEEEEKKLP